MGVNRNKVLETARKYAEKGQYDRAVEELKRVAEADPNDARIRLKIGDLYVKMGDKPRAVNAFLFVADFYTRRKQYREAVAACTQVIQIKPRNIDAYRRLASLYQKQGLTSDATRQLDIAHRVLMAQGKPDEALELAEEMVTLAPGSPQTRIRLAESYFAANRRPEALKHFMTAADMFRKENRPDDFIAVAERFLQIDPDNLDVRKKVVEVYLKSNQPALALRMLQASFRIDPQNPELLELAATTFATLNQKPQALATLRRLVKLHQAAGRPADEAKVHKRILDLVPGDPDATNALMRLKSRT